MPGPNKVVSESGETRGRDSPVEPEEVALTEPVRAFERVAFTAEVTLTRPGSVLRGVTRNLSLGGVFVACEATLPVGVTASLRMSLPEGETVDTEVVVRRCAVASELFGAGMGLQFVDLSQPDSQTIARFAGQREPMFWEEAPRREGEATEGCVLPRRVAMAFLPTIRARAQRLASRLPSHILIDDLVGAGFVGLVEAYRQWQTGPGGTFEIAAVARIQGAMLDELRAIDPLSRRVRSHARKIRTTTQRLESRYGRTASEDEIASEIGWNVDMLRNRIALIASGSAPAVSYGTHDDEVELPDSLSTDADEKVALEEMRIAIKNAFDALPPRLRQILELRYDGKLSLRDIGRVLGVTESRVSQLHSEAVERMRAATADRARSKP